MHKNGAMDNFFQYGTYSATFLYAGFRSRDTYPCGATSSRRAGAPYTLHSRSTMRRTLLTLAVALPLLSACASSGGGMRPRYDPAAGQTNLEQLILQTSGGSSDASPMRMTARYSWRGQGTPAPAPHAYLSFDAWPQADAGWPWRSDNRLQVTVDGQRARYNGRYDSETQESRRHENVVYQIPIGDLAVMAEAARVEGRIGPRSFTLEGAELARLREFVTYIRGGTQP